MLAKSQQIVFQWVPVDHQQDVVSSPGQTFPTSCSSAPLRDRQVESEKTEPQQKQEPLKPPEEPFF